MGNKRMLRLFAQLVSIVLHPMLMPLYMLMLIFHTQSLFALTPVTTKWYCYLVTVLFLILMPLLSIPILRFFHLIRHFALEDKQDRIWVLLIMILTTFLGFWLVRRIAYTDIVQRLFLIMIILQSVLSIVTLRWKISLHLTGIGGMCGMVLILGLNYFGQVQGELMLLFLLAGVLASSRLYLNRHTSSQVYVGFLFGFGMVMLLL